MNDFLDTIQNIVIMIIVAVMFIGVVVLNAIVEFIPVIIVIFIVSLIYSYLTR